MSQALSRLQNLLGELFQLDTSGDLDFGIYRIMNHKRDEIDGFIENSLPKIVETTLASGSAAHQTELANELQEKAEQVKQTFGDEAVSPDGELSPTFHNTPLGKDYLETREKAAGTTDLEGLKAIVFNHLYTFFSRYYEGGDFLSQRRYSKQQKYAIPYNGEEVYLHWANADQYYIKTGEHFTNYQFTVNDVTVNFKLVAADVEKNNVKGKDRYFLPRTDQAEYDENEPLITVPFEHRPLTDREESRYGAKNGRQGNINEEAVPELLAQFNGSPEAARALEKEKRKDSSKQPISYLQHHLRRYTAKNNSDFFVHKDLRGFLDGELDFYLKNEVLNIDDLDSDRWGEERAESWFEVMQAMKRIGREIIAFLAQIEDYQKKLFEKKKFVTAAEYCLTLDRVPEEMYSEILDNEDQIDEWEDLFKISEIEETVLNGGGGLSVQWLKDNPYLLLDTKFFGEDFKDRLLSSVENLDEQADGLLINSENFQALNLLQERYREQVKCIYIDPPYNTGGDGFLYKDGYLHSSWAALMDGTTTQAKKLLSNNGLLLASIDDHEMQHLRMLLSKRFRDDNCLVPFVWKRKAGGGDDSGHIASEHEYVLVFANNHEDVAISDIEHESPAMTAKYNRVENGRRYYLERLDKTSLTYNGSMDYPIEAPDGTLVEPPHPDPKNPSTIWRWSVSTVAERRDELVFIRDKTTDEWRIYTKTWESLEGVTPRSLLVEKEHGRNRDGTIEIGHILNPKAFRNPKPTKLLRHLLFIGAHEDNAVVFDYFAGSGTTGHAVIDLNRGDGGSRKYILTEMGEYFDSVLKPRIQKVIYSKDWKDGKPKERNTGVSHIFKYLSLEQYEDTLNNISFGGEARGQQAMELYGDDYLLRYMLDFETQDSETLLNVRQMDSPFSYCLTLYDGEATREMPVDLPETFIYLLGMRVKSRKVYYDGERRYLVYRGSTGESDETVVIWRNTEGWEEGDYRRDEAFVTENELTGGAKEVFVNGDSFLSEAKPLEPVFKQRMLAEPLNA